MSEEHTKSQTPIRTFAQDLASARGKRSQVTPEDSSAIIPESKDKTPEVPRQNFKAQAPQQTTKTKQKIVVEDEKTLTKEKPVEEKPNMTEKPVKKPTQTFPIKLPAFHELTHKVSEGIKKEAQSAEKKIVPKISVNKKSKTPSRANIGYDATIITDNKNQRFNLFSAISSSLKSWFRALTVSKKKKSPVYTVPDTQRRKGVIQRATSKSGSIFTTDSAELRAKIKQRQKLVETTRLEEIAKEGELSWSPFTDSGFNLLESPEETARVDDPQNVAVEFKKRAQSTDTAPAPKPSIPPVPVAPVTPVDTSAPETSVKKDIDTQTDDSRWEAASKKEISVVAPVETEPDAPVVLEVKTESATVSQPTISEFQTEDTSSDSKDLDIQKMNTNTLAISIMAGLSFVVVVFFVGKIAFSYITATETVVSRDTTSYLPSATPNPVMVTQTSSITDIPLQAGSLLGLDYVDTQLFMPQGEAVSPAVIVSALRFNVLPSFTQSLTDIRFAQLKDSAPIIIFEFTDAETTLGGFLAWEDTMAQDLREIYLITQLNDLTFTDNRIENTDVRVLTSATGQVLAVYGIVSNDTAIITNSLETFTQVLTASFDD